MNRSDAAPSKVQLSDRLSKLPRISATPRAAPNSNAARSKDIAYEVTSPKKLSDAFSLKRHFVD